MRNIDLSPKFLHSVLTYKNYFIILFTSALFTALYLELKTKIFTAGTFSVMSGK